MDEQNTDSDSHSVTSIQSVSSTSSKQRLPTNTGPAKEPLPVPIKPTPAQSKRKQDDDSKVASTPKRKKTDGSDPMGASGTTPGQSSTRKAAPLSERQQMALALAMSAQESGGTSPMQSSSQPSVSTDTTPRSAQLRRVNRRNEKGESPLHRATIKGDVVGMKKLLKAGADVNVPDYAGWTALHEACNHGFVAAAKLLLRKGANVNVQGLDNDTPLHDAAINAQPELVALLLKYGANPHQVNSKGESALDVSYNDEISKLLRRETVFRATGDESDQSASSPENELPKDDETISATSLATISEHGQGLGMKTESDACVSLTTEPAIDEPLTDSSSTTSKPGEEDKLSDSASVTGLDNSKTLRELKQAEGVLSSQPSSPSTTSSRPSSTGFLQEACEQPPKSVVNKRLEKYDLSNQNAMEGLTPKETTSFPIAIGKEVKALDENQQQTSRPPNTANNTSQMESQLPPSLDSLARTARQSLDFQTIKVSSPTSTEATSVSHPSSVLSSSSGSVNPPSEVLSEDKTNIQKSPQDTTAAGMETATSDLSDSKGNFPKAVGSLPDVSGAMPSEAETVEKASIPEASPADREAMESPSANVPTPVHECATPEPQAERLRPGLDPSEMATEPEELPPKSLPFSDRKPVEQVKNDAKSLSRPVSPGAEKVQRNRTGSMHRKRRQAHTLQPSSQTVDPPATPDGDNSKDSTDSHMSSNSTTRASRSRNKQQFMTSNPQLDDEPLPPRETRRKAMMLKERAAAHSPSADRLAKSGSQKVPPLTIKLSSKAPVTTAASSTTTSDPAASTSPCEPYVMLQDKETERANSVLAKEQGKGFGSPGSQDGTARRDAAISSTTAQSSTALTAASASTVSSTGTSTSSSSSVSTRRTLRSHTKGASEKLEEHVPPRKSKRMKAEQATPTPLPLPSLPAPPGPLTIFNPYSLFKGVREQMIKKWERIVTVQPRVPDGYSGYLINTKKYLLEKNASSNASKLAIPLLVSPSQLTQQMKELFNKQEQERYKLRQQHIIEGEKLRIAYEQDIVRVYTRGARAAANQETPLSVCTILKDKESGTVYHPFNALKDGTGQGSMEDKQHSERASARSHFNNRQLLSWLQDSEDKFDKLKDQMLSRHHHEAESLYAVQTMNWEWKLKELGLCDYKSQPTIDMLHVPMVLVNDDADILNSS